jgi:hypothetical protein
MNSETTIFGRFADDIACDMALLNTVQASVVVGQNFSWNEFYSLQSEMQNRHPHIVLKYLKIDSSAS